jgi:hypothetical protein
MAQCFVRVSPSVRTRVWQAMANRDKGANAGRLYGSGVCISRGLDCATPCVCNPVIAGEAALSEHALITGLLKDLTQA